MVAQGQTQIQNVAERATSYYGPDSAAAIATQQMADFQETQVPGDVNTVLTLPQLGALGVPWYLWAIGALSLYLVVRR